MSLPPRSPEQRQAALARAAEVRRKRAEIKQLLKMDNISFTELFDQADQDPDIGGMKIADVLKALPGSGPVKAKDSMEQVGISENRRLQGLTPRQRSELFQLYL